MTCPSRCSTPYIADLASIFHSRAECRFGMEFLQTTELMKTKSDIVAAVLPAARKRRMKLFCSIEDVFRSDVPGVKEVAEVDLQGRRTGTLCLFHPNVRAFWTGLATDLCKSYDIDGIAKPSRPRCRQQ
jgi:uncharacterized lipoprotein YddW (UPF0748 family)